jgi:hypothetical protein
MPEQWNAEFEVMWRNRLCEMDSEKQPFHKFIRKVVELEIIDAFKLALAEIERLRLAATACHFDQTQRPK